MLPEHVKFILALRKDQIESFEDQHRWEWGVDFDWELFFELHG